MTSLTTVSRPFDRTPTECQLQVFSYFPLKYVANTQTLCKWFHALAPTLFKRACAGKTHEREMYTERNPLWDFHRFRALSLGNPLRLDQLLDLMPSLTSVHLNDHNLRPLPEEFQSLFASPTAISRLRELTIQQGHLARASITEDTVSAIATHGSALRTLRLQAFEDLSQIASLKSLSKLTTLSVNRSQVTDSTLRIMAEMQSLTSVNIGRCKLITHVGMRAILTLPKLTHLDFSFGPDDLGHDETIAQWQAQFAQVIAEAGENLTHLELAYSRYRDADLLQIADKCKKLAYLNLSAPSGHHVLNPLELYNQMIALNSKLEIRGLNFELDAAKDQEKLLASMPLWLQRQLAQAQSKD
jgi:hypothetical protein